jgi:hypothetical protein
MHSRAARRGLLTFAHVFSRSAYTDFIRRLIKQIRIGPSYI